MSVKLSEFKTYTGTENDGIGANSVDTTTGDCFVTKTNEFVAKATAGSEISGVSLTQKHLHLITKLLLKHVLVLSQ